MNASYLFILICITTWNFFSCKHEVPTETIQSDVFILAEKLKTWTENQVEPFVIFRPWPRLVYIDIVTNIKPFFQFTDSLFIDSVNVASLEQYMKLQNLSIDFDLNLIEVGISLQRLQEILGDLPLEFRMMRFDSTTIKLGQKLLKWSRHQCPPKVIFVGHHAFINSNVNFGGYSPPALRPQELQNLQFFVRNVDTLVIQNIIEQINEDLTIDELRALLAPIATVEIEDTDFSPD